MLHLCRQQIGDLKQRYEWCSGYGSFVKIFIHVVYVLERYTGLVYLHLVRLKKYLVNNIQ